MKQSLPLIAFVVISGLLIGGEIPDTRGPVQIAGAKVAVSLDGVQAPGYVWKPFETDPEHWKASWIQGASSIPSTPKDVPRAEASLLRCTFVLESEPKSVLARIASKASYLLYVNGKPVSRGPADQGNDYSNRGHQKIPFYDLRDLTPFFHRGTNTVACITDARGELLFEAKVTMADGSEKLLISDASWKSTPAVFLHKFQIPAEDRFGSNNILAFDAAQEPVGWNAVGFDDSSWERCVGSHPVAAGELQPSVLPPCMEAFYPVKEVVALTNSLIKVSVGALTQGKPLIVDHDGEVEVLFDRVMSGRVGFKIRGGAEARIYYSTSELPGNAGKPFGVLILRDGIQTYETRRFYAIGAIHLDFRNVKSPVEVIEITADWTSQPVAYEGSFECSDPFLNTLWKACRTSVQINLQTHHLDSPGHQEPISDYGDYLIEDLVALNAFGTSNPWLMKQDLRKWAAVMKDANYHTFHTSYALLWLQALMNYYQYTGDRELIQELAPSVHELLAKFTTYVGKTLLISEAPDYMFMDWVTIQGFPAHHPPAEIGMGYMTAFFYKALGDGIHLSEILGDKKHAAEYEAMRSKIAKGYHDSLWNQEKGLYRDGIPYLTTVKPHQWMPADKGSENYSPQNNSLAVAYGLVPKDKAAQIMERTLSQTPWNLQPYFMHFVFDAMEESGLYDKEATTWLRKWTINPTTQSLLEANGMGDLSHGWTSTPLYQLSARILGVRPLLPGFQKILIEPHPCDLGWAKGTVPTPFGNVSVSWTHSKDKFELDATIPDGTEAEVILPKHLFDQSSIVVDGKTVSEPLPLDSGKHHLEMTRTTH